MLSKLALFATYFHWDPRIVDRLTLLEFDVLAYQAELIHKAETKRR